MLRILFILLLGLHGLIHFMGVMKAFVNSGPLKMAISKPVGIAWLASGLLLLTTMVGYIGKNDWWWKLAIPAIIVSQVVIVIGWQEAKFGTIVNVIVLIVLIPIIAQWNIFREAKDSFDTGSYSHSQQPDIVHDSDLAKLPESVQRWLRRANVVGNERIGTARVVQTGELKTAPDKDWTSFHAEQFFCTKTPEFLWLADVGGHSPMQFTGVDRLQKGKGHMQIRVLGLFPAVDSKGPEIDQGSLVRYLAEIIWFPTAALEDHIEWKSIDKHRAEATISVNDIHASGMFFFDANGDPAGFQAQRYYSGEAGEAGLKPWHVQIGSDSYKELNGYRIPTFGALIWKLDSGDFHWLKLHIQNAEYNQPS